MKPKQLYTSGLNRFDPRTIKNLLDGNHNPADRLPYSMLVEVLRGKDYSQQLCDQLSTSKASRATLMEAQRFLILHVKVIHALCHHYDESTAIQSS